MTELLNELLPHFPNLALLSLAVFVISFLTVVSGSNETDSEHGSHESQPEMARINLRPENPKPHL